MIRTIITINSEKCNGCGLCVDACHEGAIGMKGGKAVLLRDDYCDGLGDCLPACPTNAITFEEREALAYNEAAVQANIQKKNGTSTGCPGIQAKILHEIPPHRQHTTAPLLQPPPQPFFPPKTATGDASPSQLRQWPVQLKLVPVKADFFADAHLLVAADCSAFACADFHTTFMQGKTTVIGCPKLDAVNYAEKLTEILKQNTIRKITVVRMSVPCCAGIATAVQTAVGQCGKDIPYCMITLLPDGHISHE